MVKTDKITLKKQVQKSVRAMSYCRRWGSRQVGHGPELGSLPRPCPTSGFRWGWRSRAWSGRAEKTLEKQTFLHGPEHVPLPRPTITGSTIPRGAEHLPAGTAGPRRPQGWPRISGSLQKTLNPLTKTSYFLHCPDHALLRGSMVLRK